MEDIHVEAASSRSSCEFEIFANLILAIAFKKVIATEQKLPNVSTAKGLFLNLRRSRFHVHFHGFFCTLVTYFWKLGKCGCQRLSYSSIDFDSIGEDLSLRLVSALKVVLSDVGS